MATRKTLQILDILGKKANQLDTVEGAIPNNYVALVSDPNNGKLYNVNKAQLQSFAGVTLDNSSVTNIVNQYLTDHNLTGGVVSVKNFGAVGDGVADDTAAINNAIASASMFSDSKTVSLFDGTFAVSGAGVSMLSNVRLVFEKGAAIKRLPDNTGSYEIISINGVTDVELVDPVIIGDNDEHIGTTGEFGMGIYIVNSKNVTVRNPTISKCWGDGIYIGSIGSDKSLWNKNLQFLGKTIITNCRRQAVSVICGYDIYFEYLYGKDIIGTAPSATIDFEPNNNTQDITCRIGTVEGINTDAAFIFVHLGGYYDINIGKVIDTDSRHNSGDGGFLFLGPETAPAVDTGSINIGEIISTKVTGMPLFLFDDWYNNSSPKVTIGSYTLGEWNNSALSLADYKHSIVNHFVSTTTATNTAIGNFTIGSISIDKISFQDGKAMRPFYIAGSAPHPVTLSNLLLNYTKLPFGFVADDGQSTFRVDNSVLIREPRDIVSVRETISTSSFTPLNGKEYSVTVNVAVGFVFAGFQRCSLYALSPIPVRIFLDANQANSLITTFVYATGTIDYTGTPFFWLNSGEKVLLERRNVTELHVILIEKVVIPDIGDAYVKNNATSSGQVASFNIGGKGAMKALDLPTNDNHQFNTANTFPSIYSSGAVGASYPFLEAGHLVLQSRNSGAIRDIVFVNGTTPAVQMILHGDTGNLNVIGKVFGSRFVFNTAPPDFADDAAAATGGVAINETYRTGSVLKIRVA